MIPVELVTREKFGKMMVDTKSDRQATISLGTYQQIELLKFEDNKKSMYSSYGMKISMKTKDLVRNKQWKTGSLYIPFKIAKLGDIQFCE